MLYEPEKSGNVMANFGNVWQCSAKYEFKAILNSDKPVKWAKSIVAFANGEGGYIFVGVSDNRDVFGLTLDEIDKTKKLISVINDRHIFPHAKIMLLLKYHNIKC